MWERPGDIYSSIPLHSYLRSSPHRHGLAAGGNNICVCSLEMLHQVFVIYQWILWLPVPLEDQAILLSLAHLRSNQIKVNTNNVGEGRVHDHPQHLQLCKLKIVLTGHWGLMIHGATWSPLGIGRKFPKMHKLTECIPGEGDSRWSNRYGSLPRDTWLYESRIWSDMANLMF